MGYEKIRRKLMAPDYHTSDGTADFSTQTITVNPRYSVTTASTASNISGSGVYLCNNSTGTAAGFTVVLNMAAPTKGDHVYLLCSSFSTSTATDSVKVKLSSTGAVKFLDATNYVVTLNAVGEGLEMIATSTTRWAILSYAPSSTGPGIGTS